MQTKETSAPHASLDPLHIHLPFVCASARKSGRVSSAPRCFFGFGAACRRAFPVALRRVSRGGRRGGLPSRRLRFNSWRCSPSCPSGRPALCGRRLLACRRRYSNLGKHSSASVRGQLASPGLARIWAAIAGFRVQSANRYTTRPTVFALAIMYLYSTMRGFDIPDTERAFLAAGFYPPLTGSPIASQLFQASQTR